MARRRTAVAGRAFDAIADVPAQLPAGLAGILLAGDYMSMPYTEGAAESGYWAAAMIARRTAGRP